MLLEINKLCVRYKSAEEDTLAVRDVSLSLDRGEALALVGESGCGKSSVALSIPRLLPTPPAQILGGEIKFDGQDLLMLSEREMQTIRGEKIGVIFQEPMTALSPLHRIGDQLEEVLLLHRKMMRRARRDCVLEWLDKVGIPEPATRARAYPHELSGGMRQRVMIAMALMLEPALIIADEPTTALDVVLQAQVLELMKKLIGEKSALLFITHDLGVVWKMASKVSVMLKGEIVEQSECPEEFFAHPQHPHSRALLSAVLSAKAPRA